MASLHPRVAPLPCTPPLPTPGRSAPSGLWTKGRSIARAVPCRLRPSRRCRRRWGTTPNDPQRPPVEHRADGTAGATEHGERSTGCGTTHPATEHPAPSAGHRAPGTKHRAPSTGHRARGTGHRAPGTEHQAPSTKHQAPSIEHQASSIEHRAPSIEHRAPGTKHRAPSTSTKHRAPSTEQEDPNNADAVRRIVGDAMSTPDPRRPKLTRGTSVARATLRSMRPATARSTRPSPRTTGCPTRPVTHPPRASGHRCPARSVDSRTAGDVVPKPARHVPSPSAQPTDFPLHPVHAAHRRDVSRGADRAPDSADVDPRAGASRPGPAEAQPHAASAVAGSDLSSCASEHTLATAAGSLTRARLAEFGTTTRFRHRRRFVRTP